MTSISEYLISENNAEHTSARCWLCYAPVFTTSDYLLSICAQCSADDRLNWLEITSRRRTMDNHCECEHTKHETGLGYCPNPASHSIVTDYGRYEICTHCLRDKCMPARRAGLSRQRVLNGHNVCSVCQGNLLRYDLCDNEGASYCDFCYERTFVEPLLAERHKLMLALAENEKAVRIHSARIAHMPPDDMPGLRHECLCGKFFQTWVALAIHCDQEKANTGHGVAVAKPKSSPAKTAKPATPKPAKKMGFIINYKIAPES